MVFALLAVAITTASVPMRWPSSDPATLDLLKGSSVNCLLVEKRDWSAKFNTEAHRRNVWVAAVVRDGNAPGADLGFDAVVVEGDSPAVEGKLPVIALPARAKMRFDAAPVVGTYQGVWPGIVAEEGGTTKSAPSGAPWVNTNSGFLRFVRAAAPDKPVWIANLPPGKTVITAERYMQAIADAAMVGARWVIAFDEDFGTRLMAREAAAMKQWQQIGQFAGYFEAHPEWRNMQPLSLLALVQDVDSGALLSGGVLDMIAVKHTPVRPVPSRQLSSQSMAGTKMAVTVAPSSLTDAQREVLRAFARSGATTLNGPASWKFPQPKPGEITLSDADVKMLDDIWREVNTMTGRRNLGARLFNVSSMLSNLMQSPDGKKAVLHLVNFSGYPVENVTVHLLGKYKGATLVAPGAEPRRLEVYEVEDGTGIDVDSVRVAATLLVE